MAICLFLRNKLKEKKKKKHMLANSELLLEGMIRCGLKSNPISIFSEKELEQASNNYHSDQFLYRDSDVCSCGYDFYKGDHQNRIILIKKFDYDAGKYHIRQSISEIVALSQINHINIVKLLGCCLETKFPIQVYEVCFNRNLWDCIHTKKFQATNDECRLLSWEERLRAAAEIAYAVTYLHTANHKPTIHRNITPENVLLDENGVAKLFNLSDLISIPFGKTHVEAAVVGAIHYVPLDCFETGRVSQKSDVYSFGMLLFVLLTGKCICDIATLANEVEQNLGVSDYVKSLIGEDMLQGVEEVLCVSEYVKSLVREDRLREIVEPTIWKENVDGMLMNQKQQQRQEFAKLAVRCIEKLEEERPTMMEVTKELRHIKSIAESESE